MQLISRYNKGVRLLLCVIDIFSKYAWVVPLKDKKGVSIIAAFQSILKQSNKKSNKIWEKKGSEFCNTSFKKWLQGNNIVMYSTHNEEKSVVTERFIRTQKNKIYKYMTSISTNLYIDKLDDIVDEYNNTYHTTIKMKPVDVKDNTYNYHIIRMDRSTTGGGDTCYIKKSLSYNHKSSFCHNIENIFIDNYLPKSKPILVGMLYRPPDKPGFIDYLDNSFKESNISNIKECYLIGDFNISLLIGIKMLLDKQFYDSYCQAPIPLVKKIYGFLFFLLPPSIDCGTNKNYRAY